MTPRKLLWLVPELKGGIRSYSELLWPSVQAAFKGEAKLRVFNRAEWSKVLAEVREFAPDFVHWQHEYGLFGGKWPPFYTFPKWVEEVRTALPQAKQWATAHTVLASDYKISTQDRRWQTYPRIMTNHLLVPWVRPVWGEKTWAPLDGVVVHSRHQKPVVVSAGCREVAVIPHFVPAPTPQRTVPRDPPRVLQKLRKGRPVVMVFGYVAWAKGQDLAIAAWEEWKKASPETLPVLLLAGGVRRQEDVAYSTLCRAKVRDANLENDVVFSEFVPDVEMDAYYSHADLVLAPFRNTTGSGSLAQGFARGAPIIASDLPLNLEIAEREPGALEFFKAGDARSCFERTKDLLYAAQRIDALRVASKAYAQQVSPERIAALLQEVYR